DCANCFRGLATMESASSKMGDGRCNWQLEPEGPEFGQGPRTLPRLREPGAQLARAPRRGQVGPAFEACRDRAEGGPPGAVAHACANPVRNWRARPGAARSASPSRLAAPGRK